MLEKRNEIFPRELRENFVSITHIRSFFGALVARLRWDTIGNTSKRSDSRWKCTSRFFPLVPLSKDVRGSEINDERKLIFPLRTERCDPTYALFPMVGIFIKIQRNNGMSKTVATVHGHYRTIIHITLAHSISLFNYSETISAGLVDNSLEEVRHD